MIWVANKFIYLCTPHTGSRSTARVLTEQCGGLKLILEHHARPNDLEALDRKIYPEPFYSVLRNPYEFILRSYWYRHRGNQPPISLEEFIPDYAKNAEGNFLGPVIATYMDYVDKYFLFERGLEDFFFQVGFPYVEIPTIGQVRVHHAPRMKVEELTAKQRSLIEEAFPKDVELYNRVKAEYDGRSTDFKRSDVN